MFAEIWKGRAHFHWHFKSPNGQIVSVAESFPTKAHALRAAKACVIAIVNLWPGTPVHFTAEQSADGKRTILRWS